MSCPAIPYLTTGAVARHFRVPVWKVRRLFERGILPPAARAGLQRVIPADALPTIHNALSRAGYLPGSRRSASDAPPLPTHTAKEITDGQAC